MVAMATGDATSVNFHQQPQYQAPLVPRRLLARLMQKLGRGIFLYNVTTGLYMLDWWERCLFNALFLLFFVVACYNSGHYLGKVGAGLLAWCGDSASPFGRRDREESLGGLLGRLLGGRGWGLMN